MREQVKWDFSNYAYTTEELNGCPQCKFESLEAAEEYQKYKAKVEEVYPYMSVPERTFAVHPETVGLLCEKHYNEFRELHDADVRKGNIKSWFGESKEVGE